MPSLPGVTVTVLATFQFAGVNVSAPLTEHRPLAIGVTTTSAVGCEPRVTVYVSSAPDSTSPSAVFDRSTDAVSSSATEPITSATGAPEYAGSELVAVWWMAHDW